MHHPLQAAEREGLGDISNHMPPLRVGDVVFTRIGAYPFRQVADATGSWTNHVGIVVAVQDAHVLVGESRFPFSGTTSLSRFIARSEGRRVAVARLTVPPTQAQEASLLAAVSERAGVFYDTGFDFHSRRQFCSRYVHEVLQQATGTSVGEVQSFRDLLAQRPEVDLGFWRAWYFGSIPWKRQTVTPAGLLASPKLELIYDNVGGTPERCAEGCGVGADEGGPAC